MSATDTLINTLFDGRYRILRKLGTGGMANVYLAEDEDLGRRVAIKILNDRYASDEAFTERFRREAKSAAALSHPNIVSIYDRGDADGRPYIAMEVIEGKSLKELIVGSGPLPISEAVAYAKQILSATRFAHRHGIIHRDIKPHNILLGHEDRLKVTDFGIARSGASQMTEVGSIMGTAQYLSPEQARGAPVTAASDLYSVGIVLYEMLTGKTPFNGETPIEIAMKHVNDPPRPPSEHRPDIPPELDQVVLRALSKDIHERYGSAEEFSADLDRVEAGLPVSPETTAAATAVLTGADATAATQVLRDEAGTRVMPRGTAAPARRPPTYPPDYGYEPPRKRRRWVPWLLVLLFAAAAIAAGWYVYSRVQDELSES
ncbi:MAG TPA: protein kinase, partial [Gaiellaceae bacterium]|nr:protein kinase [Gaiellaceae bacterium]